MSLNIDKVTDHDKQPLHAFVEVYIGDHILRSRYLSTGEENRAPEYIQAFEYNKVDKNGGNFTLVIFDKNWEEIEYVFNQGFNSVKIRYGWVTGLTSPLYLGYVASYNLTFQHSGVILSMVGSIQSSVSDTGDTLPTVEDSTSTEESTLLNTTLVTLDTGTKNPTEAVRKIAESQGWSIGTYVDTEDIQSDNEDSISLVKEYPIDFINTSIAPYAVSKDGISGFKFSLDPSTNPPTSSFLPEFSSISGPPTRTYIYSKGVNSSVIDLNLSLDGVFGGSGSTYTITQSSVQTIDPTTKDLIDSSTNTNEQTFTQEEDAYTHTPSNQAGIFGASGLSPFQATASMMYAMTSSGGSIPYTGSLTVLGDPSITMSDKILLLVITSKGTLHAASGEYLIDEMVADSITGGKYLTSMKIIRATMATGLESVSNTTTHQPAISGFIDSNLSASASEKEIWDYLYSVIGNAYGVAGLMGNLFEESGLKSTNLENSKQDDLGMTDASYTAAVDAGTYTRFANDSAGYGLAQWTFSTRKQKLLEYARSKGVSIGSAGMQLEFLYRELSQDYSSVLSTLISARSIREASDIVLTEFEKPANQSNAVKLKRATYGQKYYSKYAK